MRWNGDWILNKISKMFTFTILGDRSLLIRWNHLAQLVNVIKIRIMLVVGYRLLLKFLNFPIVLRHRVVWIIVLMHVLLLCLILVMRVAIHDAELLIFVEDVANAEGSRYWRRQHPRAFCSIPNWVSDVRNVRWIFNQLSIPHSLLYFFSGGYHLLRIGQNSLSGVPNIRSHTALVINLGWIVYKTSIIQSIVSPYDLINVKQILSRVRSQESRLRRVELASKPIRVRNPRAGGLIARAVLSAVKRECQWQRGGLADSPSEPTARDQSLFTRETRRRCTTRGTRHRDGVQQQVRMILAKCKIHRFTAQVVYRCHGRLLFRGMVTLEWSGRRADV